MKYIEFKTQTMVDDRKISIVDYTLLFNKLPILTSGQTFNSL